MRYDIPERYEYLPISQDDLPVTLSIDIDGIPLLLTFRYNDQGDFYTLEIADENENLLIAQKVTYGKDLLSGLKSLLAITTKLIPLDVGYEKQENASGDRRVGIDTFGKNVELVVLRG